MSKYNFLESYKAWAESAQKDKSKSTFRNRIALYHHLNNYMQEANIPDWDLLQHNVGVQLDPEELERRADFVDAFFDGFNGHLSQLGMAKSTKHLYWSQLQSFLKQTRFKRINLVIHMPEFDRMLVQPKDRISHMTLDQVAKILQTPAKNRLHILNTKLVLLTCWRASDVAAIRVGDIELGTWQGTRVYFVNGLNQKTKVAMKTPVPFHLMSAILKANGHDGATDENKYLINFSTSGGAGMTRQVRLTNDVRKAFIDVFGNGGYIKSTDWDGNQTVVPIHEFPRPVHLLRKSGATYYAANGLPVDQIALFFTGHQDMKTLMGFYLDKHTAFMSGQFGTDKGGMVSTLHEVTTGRVEANAKKFLAEILDDSVVE